MAEPLLAEKLPLLIESPSMAEGALLVENPSVSENPLLAERALMVEDLSMSENPLMAETHHCQKTYQWWKHTTARKPTNGGNTPLPENLPMVENPSCVRKAYIL